MSRSLRILRTALLLVVLLAAALGTTLFIVSARPLSRRYPVTAEVVSARSDSAGIARGAHLYRTISCAACHAPHGGGAVYADAGAIGFLAGPNLTSGRGGVAGLRSDADWVTAIRYGVRADSTSLLVMPSEVFSHLTDSDLGAILGYLRQLSPVDRDLPPSGLHWLGRGLLAAGRLELLVAEKTPHRLPRPEVAEGVTAEYGRYLADISGCHGCHGFGLSGGAVAGPPGLPPASNLTPSGLEGWTADRFVATMRTGRRPDGTKLNDFMPWREFQHMSASDLAALWLYLQSVPPQALRQQVGNPDIGTIQHSGSTGTFWRAMDIAWVAHRHEMTVTITAREAPLLMYRRARTAPASVSSTSHTSASRDRTECRSIPYPSCYFVRHTNCAQHLA